MTPGLGITTQQMKAAPKGAIFVWVNGYLECPRFLARKIDRGDLQIVAPTWLLDCRWRGLELTGVVVDHAARLTGQERDRLQGALTRVR